MKQKGGNSSSNVQANEIVINNGISYSDARQIALDVFNANFIKLSDDAKKIARERAEEITRDFLKVLMNVNPDGLNQSRNPDFQYNLYEAQKYYAKIGDQEVARLLVDLLVNRTKKENRDTDQIAIDEAIQVVPKLTNTQINLLSIIYLIQNHKEENLETTRDFVGFIDRFFPPLALSHPIETKSIMHLQYSGCIAMNRLGTLSISQMFRNEYPISFSIGFELKDLPNELCTDKFIENHVVECKNTPNLYHFNFRNIQEFKKMCFQMVKDKSKVKICEKFFYNTLMPTDKINEILSSRDYMKNIVWSWNNQPLRNFTISTVGQVIATTNIIGKLETSKNLFK